jgi:hypothetical protein
MIIWREGSDAEYRGHEGPIPPGWVEYDGPIVADENGDLLMTWDATANAPRPITEVEIQDRARLRRYQDVNAERDRRLMAGHEVMGHRWQTDGQSITNIMGAVTAIIAGWPIPEGYTWRDAENQDVPVTAAEIVQLGLALAGWRSAVIKHGWAIKAVIDAAEDPDAVDITAGWPA